MTFYKKRDFVIKNRNNNKKVATYANTAFVFTDKYICIYFNEGLGNVDRFSRKFYTVDHLTK